MKNVKILIATLVLGFSFSSFAGLHIEPYYASVVSGKVTGTTTVSGTSTDVDEDVDGSYYGLKLGFSLPFGLGFGGNYTVNDDSSNAMGAYVSFDFPIMIRAWVGYDFKTESKDGSVTLSGTGTKVGIGYTGLPFVCIFVEQTMATFDDLSVDGFSDVSADVKANYTSVGLSLPFDL